MKYLSFSIPTGIKNEITILSPLTKCQAAAKNSIKIVKE